jgi:LysR family transcriptional regulator, hydrogen peroxide-inducible genes activator
MFSPMEMHQIRYFLAVCDSLNFTRAAEACNVTQPALTRAIQKLEEELGSLLLHRERSRTHLTDFGQLMRPHLEQIAHNAEQAASTAKSFLRLEEAPLRLGVMCTVGPTRCIGLLAQFNKDHPGVDVTLSEGVPTALTESLLAGELDIAIMTKPPEDDERLRIEPIYSERFVVAFPPGHRFSRMNAVKTKDCAGESYLVRINCEYINHWDDFLRTNNIPLREAYRSEREDWIQTMVMAGMGICFIPEFSPTQPGLASRPLIEPEVVRQVCLISVPGRRFSPAVGAFVQAVKRYPWQSAA